MSSVGATLGFIGGGYSLGVYVDYFKIDMDTYVSLTTKRVLIYKKWRPQWYIAIVVP